MYLTAVAVGLLGAFASTITWKREGRRITLNEASEETGISRPIWDAIAILLRKFTVALYGLKAQLFGALRRKVVGSYGWT